MGSDRRCCTMIFYNSLSCSRCHKSHQAHVLLPTLPASGLLCRFPPCCCFFFQASGFRLLVFFFSSSFSFSAAFSFYASLSDSEMISDVFFQAPVLLFLVSVLASFSQQARFLLHVCLHRASHAAPDAA